MGNEKHIPKYDDLNLQNILINDQILIVFDDDFEVLDEMEEDAFLSDDDTSSSIDYETQSQISNLSLAETEDFSMEYELQFEEDSDNDTDGDSSAMSLVQTEDFIQEANVYYLINI